MFKSKIYELKNENESLKAELLLTRKAADIYKNDQQEFWKIKLKEIDNKIIKVLSISFAPNQCEEENEK